MMRQGRLGHVDLKISARQRLGLCELPDDVQPDGIAQGVKNSCKFQFIDQRKFGQRGSHILLGLDMFYLLFDSSRTIEIYSTTLNYESMDTQRFRSRQP